MSRTSTARANALRRARQARAEREAERLARESRIESALTDFFEHQDCARRVREVGARRAEAIMSECEEKASTHVTEARAALRTLRTLVGSHADIAQLTGLRVNDVRAMLTSGAEPSKGVGGRERDSGALSAD